MKQYDWFFYIASYKHTCMHAEARERERHEGAIWNDKAIKKEGRLSKREICMCAPSTKSGERRKINWRMDEERCDAMVAGRAVYLNAERREMNMNCKRCWYSQKIHPWIEIKYWFLSVADDENVFWWGVEREGESEKKCELHVAPRLLQFVHMHSFWCICLEFARSLSNAATLHMMMTDVCLHRGSLRFWVRMERASEREHCRRFQFDGKWQI
jgi:hypothetical protein